MKETKSFILLAIIGVVAVGLLYWFSRPEEPNVSYVSVQKEKTVSELKNRSSYTNLPITYSAEQIGKTNPFQ